MSPREMETLCRRKCKPFAQNGQHLLSQLLPLLLLSDLLFPSLNFMEDFPLLKQIRPGQTPISETHSTEKLRNHAAFEFPCPKALVSCDPHKELGGPRLLCATSVPAGSKSVFFPTSLALPSACVQGP